MCECVNGFSLQTRLTGQTQLGFTWNTPWPCFCRGYLHVLKSVICCLDVPTDSNGILIRYCLIAVEHLLNCWMSTHNCFLFETPTSVSLLHCSWYHCIMRGPLYAIQLTHSPYINAQCRNYEKNPGVKRLFQANEVFRFKASKYQKSRNRGRVTEVGRLVT